MKRGRGQFIPSGPVNAKDKALLDAMKSLQAAPPRVAKTLSKAKSIAASTTRGMGKKRR